MELENPSKGETRIAENPSNGGALDDVPLPPRDLDEIDSSCSTPYFSAPSSPGRTHTGYYYSAPASPMHFVLSSLPYTSASSRSDAFSDLSVPGSYEFEFSARFSNPGGAPAAGSMISADELFLNGQIRPMKLSSHLQRPQVLAPLLDLEVEYDDDEEAKEKSEESSVRGRDLRLRSRSLHRRARSMSPLRNAPFQWRDEEERETVHHGDAMEVETDADLKQSDEMATPSVSASSSRSNSSSSSRNTKRWIFLKDLLYRSKSEGRGNGKEKFWQSISFSPTKEKISFFSKDKSKDSKQPAAPLPPSTSTATTSTNTSSSSEPKMQKNPEASAPKKAGTSSKPRNGVGKRRMPAPSPHERHYTANRAQMEERRRKTFLPYRQGLLGCLGFSSRSYGAMNGIARTLNPVSSR